MAPINIAGVNFRISGKVIRILRLEEEWLDCVEDPEAVIREISAMPVKPDLFSFRQEVPKIEPKYNYNMEWEEIAVLPISEYDHWLRKQASPSARSSVRKALRKGVEVRTVDFSDDLVREICAISDDTPIRQGRRYSQFGKGFDALKVSLLKDADRSYFIGAFFDNELIGYVKLACGKHHAGPFGLVAKMKHRDKSPQNALLSKSVEICSQKGIPFMIYGFWTGGGLGAFKRHNGFIKMGLPRYYIPITLKGKISLKLGLHRGLGSWVPVWAKELFIDLRKKWYLRSQIQ